MFNPQTAPYVPRYYLSSLETAALQLQVAAVVTPTQSPTDIEGAVAALAESPGSGIVLMPDAFVLVHRDLILALAAKYRLPLLCPYRSFTVGGGLMSYGVSFPDLFRRSAQYVDRILKGAVPADLPVQEPTKFELAINLKTARNLGLSVPSVLLAQADEVIE